MFFTNTFGMGQNNNNVDHHTQSVTVDREKDIDAMYRKIQHCARAPSCSSLKKTADISGCHHWFPCEMTSEKWVQKFHTDDVSLPSFGYWHISIEFLHSFLRHHFVEEPVFALWNVGCWIWPVIIPPSSATPSTSSVLCSQGWGIIEFAQQYGRKKRTPNVTNVTGPLLSRFVVICT